MRRWILLTVFCTLCVEKISSMVVEDEWKIYYDLSTNKTIDIIDSNNPRVQYYKAQAQKLLRIGFGPVPCSCQELSCGCCAGMNIQYFDFNHRACMNFSYDPHEFALKVDMFMDDNSVYANSLSGKNPPPACVPFPVPYLPAIDLCVRFFNIHTPGYNVFMCIDFETRIERAPVLVLHFDCMQMGMDGIQYHKPEDAEIGPEIEDVDIGVQSGEESEVYDEVFEDDELRNMTTIAPEKSCTEYTANNQAEGEKVGSNGNNEPYDEVIENDGAVKSREGTTTEEVITSTLISEILTTETTKFKS